MHSAALSPQYAIPFDQLTFDIATNRELRGAVTQAQAYNMVPTELAALLLIHCNRLHPVASLVFGLIHYPTALPRIPLPDLPGPLPPGPFQVDRQCALESRLL